MNFFKLLFGFIFTIVFYFAIFKSGAIEFLDYKIYDILTNVISHKVKNSATSVVVVDIDEKSLSAIGQWPWSRIILAQLTNSIARLNPTSIGYDVIFPEKDKTSPKEMINFYKKYFSTNIKIDGLDKHYLDNDKLFAESLSRSRTILPVYLNNNQQNTNKCVFPKYKINQLNKIDTSFESKYILCNLEILQNKASNIGFINSQRDKDGILRRVPLFIKHNQKLIPFFGLANLMSIDSVTINKNDISILNHSFKIGNDTNVLLKFYDNSWYKRVSAIDVLTGNIDKKTIQGRFVILGVSAAGLFDNYIISSGKNIPGVYSHVTLIDNILNDELKYQPKKASMINFYISFVMSLILIFLLYKKYNIRLLIFSTIVTLLSIVLGYYFLLNNMYISLGYFLIPFLLYFFVINSWFIFINYIEKQRFYKELSLSKSSVIDSMSLVAETRDAETGAHIIRTKEYIKCLSDYLYKKGIYKDILTPYFRELLYIANPMHDIGKVGISDEILKKPGKYTDEEFAIMQNHPYIGKCVIENAMRGNMDNDFLKIAYNIAYYHHEKYDGSGYPCKLKGEEIPLEARIMAIADVYDALISRRYYKEAFDYSESEQIIINGRNTHFDPILVDAFIEIKDKFKEIAEKIKN